MAEIIWPIRGPRSEELSKITSWRAFQLFYLLEYWLYIFCYDYETVMIKIKYLCLQLFVHNNHLYKNEPGIHGKVAEWSKALRSGRSPLWGRGFESHLCHTFLMMVNAAARGCNIFVTKSLLHWSTQSWIEWFFLSFSLNSWNSMLFQISDL